MSTSLTNLVDLPFLISRIKLVVLSPKNCWSTITSEQADASKLLKGMVAPLILVGAVARAIGLCVIGLNLGPFGTWRPPFFPTLVSQLSTAVIQVVVFLISVELVQRLAKFFSGNATRERAMSLVAHAMLPLLLAGILALFPLLGILGFILGIVGLYAFYQGVSVMTSVTEQQRLGFVASFICIMIVASVILYFVSSMFISAPIPPLS